MSVDALELEVLATLDRVERIEGVAESLPRADKNRQTLDQVVVDEIKAVPPVRPRTAAKVLGLSERTVRSWAQEGVLTPAAFPSKVLRLDAQRLHEVWHLIRELREAGKTRGLLDAVYHRLSDQALLAREDLAESLGQMRRGETVVARPRPPEAAAG